MERNSSQRFKEKGANPARYVRLTLRACTYKAATGSGITLYGPKLTEARAVGLIKVALHKLAIKYPYIFAVEPHR